MTSHLVSQPAFSSVPALAGMEGPFGPKCEFGGRGRPDGGQTNRRTDERGAEDRRTKDRRTKDRWTKDRRTEDRWKTNRRTTGLRELDNVIRNQCCSLD